MGVPPQNTLIIEDSMVGVEAGIAANMQVVGFTGGSHIGPGHGEQLVKLGAHHILENMENLIDLIETYNGS